MYIYDITHNQYQFPILDPDFSYQHIDYQKNLYPFFKQLHIPQSVRFLTGIYIEFQIIPYLIEEYHQLYFHVSKHLMEKMKEYLISEMLVFIMKDLIFSLWSCLIRTKI